MGLKPPVAHAEGNTGRSILYEQVFEELCERLVSGQLEPGRALTVRGLALELETSPMPVREALKRLQVLGALEVTRTRRIRVSPMTRSRFDQISRARTLLEPELAAGALQNLTDADIDLLRLLDAEVDAAMAAGDASAYGSANWRFHSGLYLLADQPIIYSLVRSLWLQVGPFMRQAAGRFGTANLEDQHHHALAAMQERDEQALRLAIRQDILDGLSLIEVAGS